MSRRAWSRLVVIPAISFLVLTALPRMSAAIGLDNDVAIDWGNCPQHPKYRCLTAKVVGAPRAIPRLASPATVEITVEIGGGVPVTGLVEVAAYDDQLAEVCFSFETGCRASFPVAFSTTGTFRLPRVQLPSEATIIAVKGHLESTAMAPPNVTIAVTGDGDPVLADRVGDDNRLAGAPANIHPGDAADTPPRSIEVMRALDRLDDGLFRKQAVDLDEPGSGGHVAVGFTHAFLAGDAGLRRRDVNTATLRLTLLVDDACHSDTVILLDRAVNRIAAGRGNSLPVTRLPDLIPECASGASITGLFTFAIDLKQVPVRTVSLDDLSLSDLTVENLTGSLEDGRLNVILVGHSVVDRSALDITLKESGDR